MKIEILTRSVTFRRSCWIIEHMYKRLFMYKIGCTRTVWLTSPLHGYTINIDHAEPLNVIME